MSDELLAPLNWMISITDKLLTESNLNDLQRKFLVHISDETKELRMLILSFSDVNTEQAKEMMSYEGRSQLTSIIGYSEVLLDEIEGVLSDEQRDLLHEVHSSGRQLLIQLSELSK
jgi:signal transduction histidine kinase